MVPYSFLSTGEGREGEHDVPPPFHSPFGGVTRRARSDRNASTITSAGRTNERTNEIGHGSDSRIDGELQKDQTTSYGKAGMRQGYISPHIALHRRGNYPFLGYRRMYVLILLHFDS